MEEESFTYATLRKIERAENTSPRLQKLEPRFWERLGEHLTKLRQAFQDQQEEDPTSRRTVVLADELRNTQRLAESIWGFREKKVVQAALAATRKREGSDGPPDHATPEERNLYGTVCSTLQKARDEAAITDPFSRRRRTEGPATEEAPEAPSAPEPAPQTARHRSRERDATPAVPATGPVPVAASASPAAPPGVGDEGREDGRDEEGAGRPTPGGSPLGGPGEEAQAPPLQGRGGAGTSGGDEMALRLVQALADVPRFVGLDLVDYELAKGEIGNLPRNAADSLANRGVVRILPA